MISVLFIIDEVYRLGWSGGGGEGFRSFSFSISVNKLSLNCCLKKTVNLSKYQFLNEF